MLFSLEMSQTTCSVNLNELLKKVNLTSHPLGDLHFLWILTLKTHDKTCAAVCCNSVFYGFSILSECSRQNTTADISSNLGQRHTVGFLAGPDER